MLCNDCPRRCGADREFDKAGGVCRSPLTPVIARAAPHFGEEPCISGERGSGTVFFSGCNLRCVFCQNRDISRSSAGKPVTVERLRDIFLEFQDEGVHNINLVTAAHFIRPVTEALEGAKLSIPVVWNSSGYESVESLRRLEGLVQVYMPDLKYLDPKLSLRYSAAKDYPEVAVSAIAEMYRQRGRFVLDDEDMLVSGVLVRHLILPGARENSEKVIRFIAENYPGDRVLFSLMCQYTPMPGLEKYPELQRTVTASENDALCRYMEDCGIEYGFFQEPESATDEMIPDFDLTGV